MIEVVNQFSNAVRHNTWEAFKAASTPWKVARPNIPAFQIYYCFQTFCGNYNYSNNISARMAIASRADQIYRISADYTTTGYYRIAYPAYPFEPAVRGSYRCDTFVVDVFQSAAGWNINHYVPPTWQTRMDQLYNGPKTPGAAWSALMN